MAKKRIRKKGDAERRWNCLTPDLLTSGRQEASNPAFSGNKAIPMTKPDLTSNPTPRRSWTGALRTRYVSPCRFLANA